MANGSCTLCRHPKANRNCDSCEGTTCKNCSEFLDASTFSFMKDTPKELSHSHYCSNCYSTIVEPALESYQEVMERAKKVYFFFKTQKKAIPFLRRSKAEIRIETCDDREETVLRLAFRAAEQGFNAVVDAEIISEKIRNAGYQKSRWCGVAYPAQVDGARLEKYFHSS